MPETAQAASGM